MQKNKSFVNFASKATLFAGILLSAPCITAIAVETANAFEQTNQNSIKGNVVDEFGEPMIGVTVKQQGTNNATVTDLDGNFTLKAPASANLEFSYIGYTTQVVKGSAAAKVALAPDANMLEEVVAIGFGTVKKRDVTGAIASVKSEQLLQAPTSDVAASLQGRITGLDVNEGELRIRGNRSINGSNEPLVIIDGVQGGSMSDINPQDIESVDVLKDASSTAIYGSQGANGVIIITTKKADKGKITVNYSGSVTAAFRPEHPDFRTGENYYNALLDAAKAGGSSTEPRDLLGSDEAVAAYNAGISTDYEELITKKTTYDTKHTLTISGGGEKTSARFSLGYASNGNKLKNSTAADRYTLRANIDHTMNKWMTTGVNFQLTHHRNGSSPYNKASVSDWRLGSPYGYMDESGKYVIGDKLVERPLTNSGYVNPLIDAMGNDFYSAASHGTNVVGNIYLDLQPLEALTFRTQFNSSLSNHTSGNYTDAANSSILADKGGSLENPGGTSVAQMSKNSSTYLEWNNVLTYKFLMLPKDHNLALTALTTWSWKQSDALSALSYGQTLASNLWYNLGSSNGEGSHTSSYEQYQTFSYAFRLQYDYKSKYLLTASMRRDGASRLAEGHKWDSFPSVALAWRITDEAFMKSIKGNWLDDMKIRATYGVTGNSGINVYGTWSGVTSSPSGLGFGDGSTIVGTGASHTQIGVQSGNTYTIANKDTKWEKSKTFDLGFDAYLFNNRINIVFDWYNTKTTDILLLRYLPTSSGAAGNFATYTNIGATSNKGVEFTINARAIDKKKFKWNSAVTFSANKESIDELYNDLSELVIGKEPESGTFMVGHPIKSFRTFKVLGIWKTEEADEAAIFGQHPGEIHVDLPRMVKTGEGQYTKYNADGTEQGVYTKDNPYAISATDDVQFIGSTSPKWFAGFNNDFTVGNFDFNLYFYARFGQWGTNRMANYDPRTGGKYTNMNYWVAGTNEDALLPAANTSRAGGFSDYTNSYQGFWYAENSFIKLKRITVGYSLPNSLIKNSGISKVRFYATLSDPLYWVKSDYQKGYDPEDAQRSVTFGASVNF